MEKNIRHFLEGALASTGHRGRVDARGQPRHTPSGLTRTSGHAPSLLLVNDKARRLRRHAAWMCASRQSPRRRRSSSAVPAALRIVGLEKERRQIGPRFASGPVPRQSAGTGHRRGLDGPTMPSSLIKPRCVSLANVERRPAMRGEESGEPSRPHPARPAKAAPWALAAHPRNRRRTKLKARRLAGFRSSRQSAQLLNRKFNTSPSLTMYSLPSARILPASLAPCSPLLAT